MRLINTDAASEIVQFECGKWKTLANRIIKEFYALKPIDAVPVVHSRMIDKGLERQWTVRTHACKTCGGWFAIPFGIPYKYCPGCGAKLDEKEGDRYDES